MDPHLHSLVMNLQNEVISFKHKITQLEYEVRDIRTQMINENHIATASRNVEIATIQGKVISIEQHLEDLHYDLERGDVGDLVEIIKNRLVVELGLGERSEPYIEEGHDE